MKKVLIAFIALLTVIIITGCGGNSGMNNIEIVKTSSCRTSRTVWLGDEIIYTVAVKNNNTKEINASIKDEIPKNTTYISGDAQVNDTELSWNIKIPAGETVELSYAVCVEPNSEDGGIVLLPRHRLEMSGVTA